MRRPTDRRKHASYKPNFESESARSLVIKVAYKTKHENKWEEILTCPGQGAALENGTGPHSHHGAWETVGALQDATGSPPNAKDPNEQDRRHDRLPEDQPGAVGGELCDRRVAKYSAVRSSGSGLWYFQACG